MLFPTFSIKTTNNDFIPTNFPQMSLFTIAPTGEEYYHPTPYTRIQKTSKGKYIPTYKYYSRVLRSSEWVSAYQQEWQPPTVYTLHDDFDQAVFAALSAFDLHRLNHQRFHLQRCLFSVLPEETTSKLQEDASRLQRCLFII
jgi:hypothetical protein